MSDTAVLNKAEGSGGSRGEAPLDNNTPSTGFGALLAGGESPRVVTKMDMKTDMKTDMEIDMKTDMKTDTKTDTNTDVIAKGAAGTSDGGTGSPENVDLIPNKNIIPTIPFAFEVRHTIMARLRMIRYLSSAEGFSALRKSQHQVEVLGKRGFFSRCFGTSHRLFSHLTNKLWERRKLLFFALVHAGATLVVYVHFFLQKKHAKETAMPPAGSAKAEKINLYWWKRLVPPLEFGAMHAILFQMGLLPLTMARSLIANLSTRRIGRFVPFEKAVAVHIWLGYVMVFFVFASTVLFFAFFGQLCVMQKDGEEPLGGPLKVTGREEVSEVEYSTAISNGTNPNEFESSADGSQRFRFIKGKTEKTFCDKMTSEIMITGLCILGCLLLVFFTSFFRNKIRYEIFYGVHHLVFIMFGLAIMHTLDDQFREGKKPHRSQNFKWFSASLILYLTDRIQAHFSKRECRVVEVRALGGEEKPEGGGKEEGTEEGKEEGKEEGNEEAKGKTTLTSSQLRKVVHLRIQRPKTFTFRPGQWVYLRIKSIDEGLNKIFNRTGLSWHPFSISSGPNDDTLDFYIEVIQQKSTDGDKSWSALLWEKARERVGTIDVDGLKVSFNKNLPGSDNPQQSSDSRLTTVTDEREDVEFPWTVEVLGPYGTGFNESAKYQEIIAIGSGTGIVPMLSLAKQKMEVFKNVNAAVHRESLLKSEEQARAYAQAFDEEST